MADRFALHSTKKEIEQQFEVQTNREDYFQPDYNISAGSLTPAILWDGQQRKVHHFQWGMIPENADEERAGREHTIYKSKEMLEDDDLKTYIRNRRCLVPAHGFYKWKSSEKQATPFYVRLLSDSVAALAGIYSVWQSESGRDVYSFALLTTDANVLVKPVDDRMPVIIEPEHYAEWLGEKEITESDIEKLIKPYPPTKMVVNRVSEAVNDINSTGPELIQPIPK